MKKYKFSWISKKLVVGKNEKGFALYANQNIKKDERLIVFGGHVLTVKEHASLPKSLFDMSIQIDEDLLLGATSMNELEKTEYINHSCDPSCGFSGPISIVAMRNIQKGEEATIDYSMCLDKLLNMKCLCKSDNCRGIIREGDWKKGELQKRYKGYFSPFLEKKINKLKYKKI